MQTVAKKLHDTEVNMKIIKTKAECDHVQFEITQSNVSGPGVISSPMPIELETLSVGMHNFWKLSFFCFEKKKKND